MERRLGLHYNLDLEIPKALTAAINAGSRYDGVAAPQSSYYDDMPNSHNMRSIHNMQDNGHSFSEVEASGIRLLSDNSVSYARRERIAMSILTGKYSREIGEVRSFPHKVSSFETESAVLAGVVQGPVRGELKGPNFLELSCSSVAVDLRSPRRAADEKRQWLADQNRENKEVRTSSSQIRTHITTSLSAAVVG